MLDLTTRFSGSEMMDDPDAEASLLEAALVELPHINRFLGGYRATMVTLEAFRRSRSPGELRILDLGSGICDYPLRMIRWGLQHQVDVRVTAVDISPATIDFAREMAARQPHPIRSRIDFKVGDALDLRLPSNSYDICTSALFLHHLTDDECAMAIRQMLHVASEGIIVNDIHRHLIAYHGIRLFTRLFRFSEMVRHDAPVSVLRAFRRSELEDVASEAGLVDGSIRWRWAFRWIMTNLPQDGYEV